MIVQEVMPEKLITGLNSPKLEFLICRVMKFCLHVVARITFFRPGTLFILAFRKASCFPVPNLPNIFSGELVKES